MVEASVVIPTYNRAERLHACLTALQRQTQAASHFEVVVVVDGSTDGTAEMLAGLRPQYALRVIEQPNLGQCVALNRGVAEAQGALCIILDDDISACPELVAEHLHLHRERRDVVGIGQLALRLPPDADWFARHFARDWGAHYGDLNRGERQPDWEDCFSGNMSVARAALLEAGGFAADLRRSFDVELAFRLKARGHAFAYLPRALGYQDERKGFTELAADSEKAGAASVELYRRHPATLPTLLGRFAAAKLRWKLSSRLLLTFNVSPASVKRLARLFGQRGRTYAWYRALHRYCFWRGVRQALPDDDTWQRLTYGVPILAYHAFGADGEAPKRFIVPRRRFKRQMTCLKWMRYCVLGLDEYLRCLREHRLPPARSVVITIDDGYADNWFVAHPVLRRYRYPATVFLVSDYLGTDNRWDQQSELTGRPLLSWSNVQEMLRNGIQIGAHTRTHPRLTTLSSETARTEIEGSRAALEQGLGVPVLAFCYPYGDHNPAILTMADQAGFLGSCTVLPGLNSPVTPLHALRRIEIYGRDSLLQFAIAVLSGERLQTLWKSIRRWQPSA